MRFAYIDSQGKEVGIPTVEALQLRIELGAITEETIFYDASKDRWDPAGDHEIFRTLSREIRERAEDGPRPPTPRVTAADVTEGEEVADGEDDVALSHEGSEVVEMAKGDQGDQEDPLADTAAPAEVGWVEVELEDVHEPEATAGGAGADVGDDWDVDLGEFGGLELAPDLDDASAEEFATEEEPVPVAEVDGPEVEPPPDIADLGGGLELEASLEEQHGDESSVEPDSASDTDVPLAALEHGPGDSWAEPSDAFDTPDSPGSSEVEDDGGSEDAAEEVHTGPMGWAAEEERDLPPAGPVDAPPDAAERVRKERARRDPYDRRVQRPRTDAPSRRRKPLPRRRSGPSGSMVALIAAVVAVLGVGGWFGWSALRGSAAAEAPEPAPALPPLPAELEAAMGPLAGAAYGDMLDSLRGMADGLPTEPNPDWLAGVYLANAGEYPDVLTYWEGLRDHLDRVRSADDRAFALALRDRLEASEVAPESRDTVAARALAGFRAASSERRVVYDQLGALVTAAIDLHEFLVGNEGSIDYEPAAGLSRDPVTEAIPASPALGEEMWDRVEEIPTALEALGTLDRVTTERILDVFYRRLGEVGVR